MIVLHALFLLELALTTRILSGRLRKRRTYEGGYLSHTNLRDQGKPRVENGRRNQIGKGQESYRRRI